MLAMAALANAQQINEEEAAQIARGFWNKPSSSTRHRVMASGNPVLAYTAEKAGEKHFYVFNNSAADGFVIVAGDGAAQQILGYSYQGTFDYATAPENVKWWLTKYEEDIHESIALQAQATAGSKARTMQKVVVKRAGVDNLITTKWNQDKPFNDFIPQLAGASGKQLFPTGCVPTAMSQVMKKFNYPDTTGIGSNEYQRIYNSGADTIVFRADFAGTTYNWEQMNNRYSSSNDATEVARLMYHCGVSVNAEYNSIESGGTSAFNKDIPKALINYFGYDKGAQHISRKFYTDEEWENLIHAELLAGRPVIYGGQAPDGGHAFVLHGYNEEKGTFSINWGWGGSYDGYYALTGSNALRPSGSGIGGASSGSAYTSDQEAVIGIRPNVGGDYVWSMETTSNFAMSSAQNMGSTLYNVTIDKSQGDRSYYFCVPVINSSVVSADFEIGLMFIDENTKKSKIVENIARPKDLGVSSGYAFTRTINTSILEYNGTYKAYPVFRVISDEGNNEWKRAMIETSQKVPTITVINGAAPEQIDVNFKIGASAIKEEDNTTLTWNSNYTGSVTYSVDKPDLVSISRSGSSLVITGKTAGTVTLTVNAAAQGYYNKTERTFEITITEVPVVPVAISISGTEVAVKEALQITHDPGYNGPISYSCDNEGIVSIDENGKVTGLAEGTVRITVTADGTRKAGEQFFTRTVEYFDVTVTAVPNDIYIVSVEIPNNGYLTTDGISMSITVKNNSGEARDFSPKAMVSTEVGNLTINCQSINIGKDETVTLPIPTGKATSAAFTAFKSRGITELGLVINNNGKQMLPTDKSKVFLNLTDKLNVTASTSENGWGTLMLPYDAELPAGLKVYSCSNAENNLLILNEVTDSKLNMDTPYIIQGNGGSYTFTGPTIPNKLDSYTSGLLMGYSVNDTVPKEAYILGTREGVTAFYKVNGEEELPVAVPYVPFISLPEAGNINEGLYLNEEDAFNAGITNITIDAANIKRSGIYSINGMKLRNDSNVNGLQRGLYIINGKKISKQ